jgi:hypothetical protein
MKSSPSARKETGPRDQPSGTAVRRILLGELGRMRLMFRRYPVEGLGGIATLAFMFLVFVALGQVANGNWAPFTGSPRVLAMLYGLWITAGSTLGACVAQVGTESATGLLESLFLGTWPVNRVLEMRALAQLLQATLIGALMVVAFCLGTGWRPSAAVAIALPAAVLACHATTLGLAMALSGAALLTKRMAALMLPVNVGCMLAIVGGPGRPAEPDGAWLAVPYVAVASAMRSAVDHEVLAVDRLAIGAAVGMACLLAGRRVLARCVTSCRRAGSLHVY